MRTTHRWKIILLELLLASLLSLLFYSLQKEVTQSQIYLELDAQVTQDDQFQLFYTDTIAYNQEHSIITNVSKSNFFQKIIFILPKDSMIHRFRLDPGNKSGNVLVRSLRLVSSEKTYTWSPDSIVQNFVANEYISLSVKGDNLLMKRHGVDPHIFLNTNIKDLYQGIVESLDFRIRWIPILWSGGLFLLLFVCLRLTHYSDSMVQWLGQPPSHALIVLFVLLLSLPLLNFVLPVIPEFKDHEKRDKRTLPIFNMAIMTSYPDQFTEYFNDNFGFRSMLTKLNSYYKTQLLRSSPLPDKVVLGKNDWLFLSDNHDLNYAAAPLLEDRELEEIYSTLGERSRLLKEKGIDYYVLIIPDKSVVYPEYLPSGFQERNVNARMDQLFKKLEEDSLINVIDVRALLMQEKKKRELYYSSDTHWNIYAGMLVYDDLIKTIRKRHPDISTRAFSDFTFSLQEEPGGDLGDLLNAPELYEKKVYLPKWKTEKKVFDMKEMRVKYQKSFTHLNPTKTGGKKLLFYHDSFGLFFIKRMEEDFYESSFYWKNNYSNEDIEDHKPDIVVHEIVTRFIPNLKD